MTDMKNLDAHELEKQRAGWMRRYQAFQSRNLQIDMTRGKPCAEQLDLALGMLDCVDREHYRAADGTDCRNYGGLDGIPEAKRLFAAYMEVAPDEVIVGGNSSLNMMYDAIARAMIHGVADGAIPWGQLPAVKFLCPSPGYDRHFAICEHMGMAMIPVEMKDDGPDMDQVEALVAGDESIKGMWCVPKYSNPTGATYADQVVERLAAMRTKAQDFRVFWDNAYAVHHLTETPDPLQDVLVACKRAGNPDRVLLFGSTSKVSLAGAGLAMMAGSVQNVAWAKKHMAVQTIGPDKLNQLRHVRFFKDMAGIEAHMRRHAAILKPKFDAVQEVLERELGPQGAAGQPALGLASNGCSLVAWSKPNGGYFVSLDTPDGCARAVVDMAARAGVKLTPAGSTFPYKQDPRDRNIRIAPSFPPVEDIRVAMEVVAVCVQLAGLDRRMGR